MHTGCSAWPAACYRDDICKAKGEQMNQFNSMEEILIEWAKMSPEEIFDFIDGMHERVSQLQSKDNE